MKKVVSSLTVIALILSINIGGVAPVFAQESTDTSSSQESTVSDSGESQGAVDSDRSDNDEEITEDNSQAETEDEDTETQGADIEDQKSENNSEEESQEISDTQNEDTAPKVESPNSESSSTESTTAAETPSGETTTPVGAHQATSTATTTIETGDSISSATIVNTVNTNAINSDVDVTVVNQQATSSDHIDLSDLFSSATTTSSGNSSSGTTTVNNSSSDTADINNVVIVRSDTGNNSASTTGEATILTGDAYANATVVTIANSTFIDSNFLLYILNHYGDLNGDIVLPIASNFESFLSSLRNANSSNPTALNIGNRGDADVQTDVTANATTGNNSATSLGSSTIQTGDVHTGTTVINQINQTYLGGNEVNLIFRVFGNWTGTLFNAPEGLQKNITPFGIELYGFFSTTQSLPSSSLSTLAQSNAVIRNDIDVAATTGDNNSLGMASATIATGEAYSAATVVNVANSTVIGRNWLNAIVNIYGDWTGNISFGQPNLWVGSRAEFPNGNSKPGARISYHFTIKNNGSAPAHNVVFTQYTNSEYVLFDDPTQDRISLGTLAPDETQEITILATVSNGLPFGPTPVTTSVEVRATESDADKKDNSDVLNIILSHPDRFVPRTEKPDLVVTKTSSADTISASSTVDYTVTIKNKGSRATNAVFIDEIKTESGAVIHTERWELGDIKEDEEITITYSAFFSADTVSGVYTNNARVISTNNSFTDSETAATSVIIEGGSTKSGSHSEHEIHEVSRVYPLHPLFSPLASSGAKSVEGETTDATGTPSDIIANTNLILENNTNHDQLAGAFEAVKNMPWYWLVLILLLVVSSLYFTERQMWYNQNREETNGQ